MSKLYAAPDVVYGGFEKFGGRLAARLDRVMQIAKASKDLRADSGKMLKLELSKMLVDAAVELEQLPTESFAVELPF